MDIKVVRFHLLYVVIWAALLGAVGFDIYRTYHLEKELAATNQEVAANRGVVGQIDIYHEACKQLATIHENEKQETLRGFRDLKRNVSEQLNDIQKRVDGELTLIQKKESNLNIIQQHINDQLVEIRQRVDSGREVCERDVENLRLKVEEGKKAWDRAVKDGLPEMAKKIERMEYAFQSHIDEAVSGGHYWTKKFAEYDKAIAELQKAVKK